jgi:hypothetical protein
MAVFTRTELQLDHYMDRISNRHYLNGVVSVLHCHHYLTLYTQLADDCGMLDGRKLMEECAEDTFYKVLVDYYQKHNITCLQEQIVLAEQYYAVAGMGKMVVLCAGPDSGSVELLHSHLDEGWIAKWGQHSKPVNFFTNGYLAALFAAAFDRPTRSYSVQETASIVAGAQKSHFEIVVR